MGYAATALIHCGRWKCTKNRGIYHSHLLKGSTEEIEARYTVFR